MNHFSFNETRSAKFNRLVQSNLRYADDQPLPTGKSSFFGNACRNWLMQRFANLKEGQIQVHEKEREWSLGDEAKIKLQNELKASIEVNHPNFYRRILFGGTIGAAEAFVDGDWDTDDLTAVIQIFIRNLAPMLKLENRWARLRKSAHWVRHLMRRNTKTGSQKNIHEHYDLGNDFYSRFLDPTMNYSSGIFPHAEATMLEASQNKMQWIGTKLQLQPTDHVLEIGTGWGGLAIHLATNFGCRVTTTTISKEQHRFAEKQIQEAGLSDQISLLLQDYRDLEGSYDKLVSIEMIEAVGHQYFDQYFGKCSSLLKDDGLMLIQSINMSEQNYEYHIRNVDFIRRYIFPGGCLPSVSAIGKSIGNATDMRVAHQEDITEHYVETLKAWRVRFHEEMAEIRELGYDRQFIRLWHFYLCYCEAAFAERRVHLNQMLFAKPKSKIDPANDFTTGLTKAEFGTNEFLANRLRVYNEPNLEPVN